MSDTRVKILLTGGSGALGTELQKRLTGAQIPFSAPQRAELAITSLQSCQQAIELYDPEIIIHCAAWTDVAGAERDRHGCWQVNVEGTQNMVKASTGRRFVFISTDYIFDGEQGNYREDDTPNPTNYYGLTKLIAESIVRQYPKTLSIRTTFKKDGPWPYPKAFIDQFSSADFVSERAPQIVRASLIPDLQGVIHIAGDRKSIYELARRASPDVGIMSLSDILTKLPRDASLDCSRWKKIIHDQES